jgi:hypothetical protein
MTQHQIPKKKKKKKKWIYVAVYVVVQAQRLLETAWVSHTRLSLAKECGRRISPTSLLREI